MPRPGDKGFREWVLNHFLLPTSKVALADLEPLMDWMREATEDERNAVYEVLQEVVLTGPSPRWNAVLDSHHYGFDLTPIQWKLEPLTGSFKDGLPQTSQDVTLLRALASTKSMVARKIIDRLLDSRTRAHMYFVGVSCLTYYDPGLAVRHLFPLAEKEVQDRIINPDDETTFVNSNLGRVLSLMLWIYPSEDLIPLLRSFYGNSPPWVQRLLIHALAWLIRSGLPKTSARAKEVLQKLEAY